MTKDFLVKLSVSNNKLIKFFVSLLRKPVIFIQFWLLTLRKDSSIVQLIKRIQKERGFMMWPDEMAFLYTSAVKCLALEGNFAEVGVSSAGSSKLIAEVIKNVQKNLLLFDAFEGLPSPSGNDVGFQKSQYACSLDSVKAYLKNYPRVQYFKGLFPESAAHVPETARFSFVHLDADLYESTLSGLKFFYP